MVKQRGTRARDVALPLLVAAAAMSSGCESTESPPCDLSPWPVQMPTTRDVDELDLLFVINNTESMAAEQAALIAELPRVVRALASGDRDGNGTRDIQPIRSLHVGVVTTDMGGGPFSDMASCPRGVGDDGLLRASGATADAPCVATYPSPVFAFGADGVEEAEFVAAIGCVARVGTDGCSFTQPLEAALKALSPRTAQPWTRPGYTPPRFADATGDLTGAGHGEGANAGFLRPDSALAIVIVSDEDDCSFQDPHLLSNDDPTFASTPPALRCARFLDVERHSLHGTDRYVAGFLGLRARPERLFVTTIGGIPPEAEATADARDFESILVLPAMAETPDASETGLVPSCTTRRDATTLDTATPPIRLVQTLAGLNASGAGVSLSSICATSLEQALDRTLDGIANAVNPRCLPSPVYVHDDGRVRCELFEVFDGSQGGASSGCASLPGRELVDVLGTGSHALERCRLTQLSRDDLSGPGWYYDDAALTPDIAEFCGATPQRIRYHGLEEPSPAMYTQFACSVDYGSRPGDALCDRDDETCDVGWLCEPAGGGAAVDHCATGAALPLVCDAVDRACAMPCTSDEDCVTASPSDLVCDTRTNASAAGLRAAELPSELRGRMRGVCVRSSCD